jgi:hypothetical protein
MEWRLLSFTSDAGMLWRIGSYTLLYWGLSLLDSFAFPLRFVAYSSAHCGVWLLSDFNGVLWDVR